MSLAKRCEEENSLFSKTQTFADLSISKVFALLAAPEEVAVEVVENNDISEMTVRELKEEIADLKSQNAGGFKISPLDHKTYKSYSCDKSPPLYI